MEEGEDPKFWLASQYHAQVEETISLCSQKIKGKKQTCEDKTSYLRPPWEVIVN